MCLLLPLLDTGGHRLLIIAEGSHQNGYTSLTTVGRYLVTLRLWALCSCLVLLASFDPLGRVELLRTEARWPRLEFGSLVRAAGEIVD